MLVSRIGSMVGPFPSNTGAVKRTQRMWLLSPAKPSQKLTATFASEKEAEIAPKGSKGRFPSINFQVRSVSFREIKYLDLAIIVPS